MSRKNHTPSTSYLFSKPFIWLTSILAVTSNADTASAFVKDPNIFEEMKIRQQEYERLSQSYVSKGSDYERNYCGSTDFLDPKCPNFQGRNFVFFKEDPSSEERELPLGQCSHENDVFYCGR